MPTLPLRRPIDRDPMTPERFAKLKQILDRRQPDLTVLLENVHKSHNIAAIQRGCDAVGVHLMHAVSAGDDVRRHRLISGGTAKWVPIQIHAHIAAACDHLRTRGFTILAAHASPSAIDYREPDYTVPCAILMGSELLGVSDEAARLADRHLVIPMEGMVESLNVSVAAALILYEARRQRHAAGLYGRRRLSEQDYRRTLFEWAHPVIARRCRELGRPYPALDEHGRLQSNPLQR